MNSTYFVGIGALILTGVFYGQSNNLPGVAQRLPVLLIWIVAGLAVLMIIEEVLKQRRIKHQDRLTEGHRTIANKDESGDAVVPLVPEDDDMPPINWKVVISFSLALLTYVLLIPSVGYIVTTVAFVAGVLLFSQTIRPVTTMLTALGITAFVWVVFVWALGLPVPLLPWLN